MWKEQLQQQILIRSLISTSQRSSSHTTLLLHQNLSLVIQARFTFHQALLESKLMMMSTFLLMLTQQMLYLSTLCYFSLLYLSLFYLFNRINSCNFYLHKFVQPYIEMNLSLRTSPLFFALSRRTFHSSPIPFAVIISHPSTLSQTTKKAEIKKSSFCPTWKNEVKDLDESTIEEIVKLRNSDPFTLSRKKLAEKYSISPYTVNKIAPLSPNNREKIISAAIYAINPTENWKGPLHYHNTRKLQKERQTLDKQRVEQYKKQQELLSDPTILQ